MKRHYKRSTIYGKPKHLSRGQKIVMSQVEAGLIDSNPSKLILTDVFPIMVLDDMGTTSKADPLLVALGESWFRRCM